MISDLKFSPISHSYRGGPDGDIFLLLFEGVCRGVGTIFAGVFRAPEQDRLRNRPRDFICGLAV